MLIPLSTASAYMLQTQKDITSGLVKIGNAKEIETNKLDETTKKELEKYYQLDKQGTAPTVLIKRTITHSKQKAGSRGGRKDLKEEYEALKELNPTEPLIQTLLSPNPDAEQIKKTLGVIGGTLEHDGNTTTMTINLDPGYNWHTTLGGQPTKHEIKRTLIIVANHAKWRDRKLRRLSELTVQVLERHVKL